MDREARCLLWEILSTSWNCPKPLGLWRRGGHHSFSSGFIMLKRDRRRLSHRNCGSSSAVHKVWVGLSGMRKERLRDCSQKIYLEKLYLLIYDINESSYLLLWSRPLSLGALWSFHEKICLCGGSLKNGEARWMVGICGKSVPLPPMITKIEAIQRGLQLCWEKRLRFPA